MKRKATHVTKRIGKGQPWGTVGVDRQAMVAAVVSPEKADLVKGRAKGQGMTVSNYINHLLLKDIGPGYDAS